MINFSREFFLPETREGFTIDTTMKTYWASAMEVLREISEVCERHGIQWYAAYGTLLGAIRHKGYVPWDDDMDIWMMREDYDRFMKVAPYELPKGYVVQSPLTEAGYTQFHSCVFNELAVSMEKEHLEKFHGCPFATGIDIFPLDYLPENEEEREGERTLFGLLGSTVELLKSEERTEEENNTLKESFDTLEEFCGVDFSRELLGTEEQSKLLNEVYVLENQLCASYKEEDGDKLIMYMDYYNWPIKVYNKEWFQDVILWPFEEIMIPVPIGYDEILRRIYGDYNIRVRNTTCHEYPIYKKQLEFLRKTVDDLEEKVNRVNELLLQEQERKGKQ